MPVRSGVIATAVFLPLAAYLLLSTPGAADLPYRLFPDATMRLVMIRDLLDGQGWYDMTQHRLGLDGVEMHWSRLADLPVAALILVFDLFTDRAGAEYLALLLWPLVLFWALLALVARIAATSGGASSFFACLLAGLAFVFDPRVAPGNIDHHALQLVLLFAALSGYAVPGPAIRRGTVSGLALATALAVGVETMPMLAIVAAAFAVTWAVRGPGERPRALAFFATVAVALPVLFVATAPRSAWSGGVCDSLTTDLLVPVTVGALLAAISVATGSNTGRILRFCLLGVIGTVVVGLLRSAFPSCLSGPYAALDPYLAARWLDLIGEAKGIAHMFDGSGFAINLGYYPLGLLGLCMSLWMARRRDGRAAWLALAALIALSLAITLYQVRGALVLKALTAIPVGVLIARLRDRWKGGSPAAGLSALAVLILSIPLTWAVFHGALIPQVPADPSRRALFDCFDRDALARLAAEPPGLVSAGTFLGNQVLLHTDHRVLSAPYIRGQEGMRAQLEIALADGPKQAESLLRASGVTHVLACEGDPELASLSDRGFTGFGHALASGAVPAFLEPLPVPRASPLRVYRVRPQS